MVKRTIPDRRLTIPIRPVRPTQWSSPEGIERAMRLQKRKIPKTITIDNPAWLESYERRNQIRHSGYCEEDFYPEDYDKVIPEDGAWIMLLVSVKVGKETGIDDNGAMMTETITVPHLSIWFAKPTVAGNGAHQAIIQTPQALL